MIKYEDFGMNRADNTPKVIDDVVIGFCTSIVKRSKPEYVKVNVEIDAKANFCYENVMKKIKNSGGRRQLGWRIQINQIMIEAIHHAIWISDDGEKLDVTPQEENDAIVFLPDNETLLGEYKIGEKYQALVEDPCVIKYIELCQKESEYKSKTKLSDKPKIPENLKVEMKELEKQIRKKYKN